MRRFGLLIALLVCGLGGAAAAQSGSARPLPPAPALQAGGTVVDARGQLVGRIESVGESPDGEMFVVVNAAGKLVTIAETQLRWNGRNATTTLTREQILAGRGAGQNRGGMRR